MPSANPNASLQPLTTADWEMLQQGLVYLWLWAGAGVLAALTWLVGHGVIPSLIGTASISPRLGMARPPLYVVAIGAALFALYALAQLALIYVAVFLRIYPRFVI